MLLWLFSWCHCTSALSNYFILKNTILSALAGVLWKKLRLPIIWSTLIPQKVIKSWSRATMMRLYYLSHHMSPSYRIPEMCFCIFESWEVFFFSFFSTVIKHTLKIQKHTLKTQKCIERKCKVIVLCKEIGDEGAYAAVSGRRQDVRELEG